MSDEQKPLTGKAEQVVRTVERTLAATQRREQPGVKITNLASGKMQVEVHAYDDDVTVAGDRAREEFNRQLGLESVPVAELEQLRWLASIGQVHMAQSEQELGEPLAEFVPSPPAPDFKQRLEEDIALVEAGKPHDIDAGPGRRRRSVQAVGDTTDDLMAKLRAVTEDSTDA